jgi:hypothetical protein
VSNRLRITLEAPGWRGRGFELGAAQQGVLVYRASDDCGKVDKDQAARGRYGMGRKGSRWVWMKH